MTRSTAAQAALERGIREKVTECPEGDIIGWTLTIGSGAQAIGMPSGVIDPLHHSEHLPLWQRRALQRLTKVLLLARGAEADRVQRENAERADGRCLCSGCGLKYSQHVEDPFADWLNVLCDGSRVKL